MISILLFILIILLIIASIFLVTYAFTNDVQAAIYVFKESFVLAFDKKVQDKAIKNTAEYLNKYFKQRAVDIVGSKDKELCKELKLTKSEVNDFKNKMRQLIQNKNTIYISEEAIKKAIKKNKSFNFFNLLVANTQNYSNDRFLLLKKLEKDFKDGKIDEKRYYYEMLHIGKITPKEAKLKLKYNRKNSRNIFEYIFPFVQKIISQNDNIKTMYDYSMRA